MAGGTGLSGAFFLLAALTLNTCGGPGAAAALHSRAGGPRGPWPDGFRPLGLFRSSSHAIRWPCLCTAGPPWPTGGHSYHTLHM
jgi:hypothetical protein